jgi:hypothetical protein
MRSAKRAICVRVAIASGSDVRSQLLKSPLQAIQRLSLKSGTHLAQDVDELAPEVRFGLPQADLLIDASSLQHIAKGSEMTTRGPFPVRSAVPP